MAVYTASPFLGPVIGPLFSGCDLTLSRSFVKSKDISIGLSIRTSIGAGLIAFRLSGHLWSWYY